MNGLWPVLTFHVLASRYQLHIPIRRLESQVEGRENNLNSEIFDTFTPKLSIMDYQKVYLLSVLIEYADSVTDVHKVFGTECLAMEHMQREIAEVSENFTGPGRRAIDMPTCVEWRDEDGYGYTVCVEELDVM